jgi:hypothetical protein
LTGQIYVNKCTIAWNEWAANANKWFQKMGYESSWELYPSRWAIQSRLQGDELSVFYELAHGDSYEFLHSCPMVFTRADDIDNWLNDYANVPFAFIGSCGGMCESTSGTFSYEFRKGKSIDATTVGYCGMAEPECDEAWSNSVDWQDELFRELHQGSTMRTAFDRAMAAYPMCFGCMVYHGDRYLTLVPIVTRSICDTLDTTENPLTFSSRGYHIRCDVVVPEGAELTVEPLVDFAFMFGSGFIVDGTFIAYGAEGPVRFLSEAKRYRGIEVTGSLRMSNGGTIRIYND